MKRLTEMTVKQAVPAHAVLLCILCGHLCAADAFVVKDGRARAQMAIAQQPPPPPSVSPLPREFVAVRDAISQAPIVVFKDAPPYTRRAADELAEYIEKISGAKPKVVEGEPEPVPTHAIWVGFQPKLKELFRRADFDFQHPEEILIAANEDHLVIAGRDRWDPDHLVVEGVDQTIVGKQQEYGTVNAVYTFLQDYLDVRWLWPGELGEDTIEKKTISFASFEYRYHPQIRARGGVFHFSSLGKKRGYGRSRQ